MNIYDAYYHGGRVEIRVEQEKKTPFMHKATLPGEMFFWMTHPSECLAVHEAVGRLIRKGFVISGVVKRGE